LQFLINIEVNIYVKIYTGEGFFEEENNAEAEEKRR